MRCGPSLSLALCVSALAGLVLSGTFVAVAQGGVKVAPKGLPQCESGQRHNDTSHGQASGQEVPRVGLCQFALTFRHQPPNFICEQMPTSSGHYPTRTMNAEVTFEKGHERYLNITIYGKAPTEDAVRAMKFISTGKLGISHCCGEKHFLDIAR